MEAGRLEELLRNIGIQEIRVRNNNIHGLCPYHSERRPSWGISTNEPHLFGCFSCGAKGDLRKLLFDVGNWNYAKVNEVVGAPTVNVRDLHINLDTMSMQIAEDLLLLYRLPVHVALEISQWRKIRPRAFVKAKCKYNHHDNTFMFPWYLDNRLYTLTARNLDLISPEKSYSYGNGSKGVTLYLPQGKITGGRLVVVEGEFDALKVYDSGFPNVGALGFGVITDHVVTQIEKSDCDSVIAFFDCDSVGMKLTRELLLRVKKKRVYVASYDHIRDTVPDEVKLDPNYLSRKEIEIALNPGFALSL